MAANILGGPTGGTGTAGTKTLTVGGLGNTVVSGSLLNGASAVPATTTIALTKVGAGTLTFNGSVDASILGSGAGGGAYGTVTVNEGTLAIDFSNAGANADLLNSYSPVSLGGGSLQMIGNAANASTQNFNNGSGVTANPGLNVIAVGPNGGNLSDPLPTLNLGAFTQTAGSQTMFVGPAYDNNASGTTANLVPATGTISTTTLGNQNNLLWPGTRQAVATVGLYEWASVVTTPAGTHNILAGSQQTGTFYTQVAAGATAANADLNYDLLGNATFNNSKPAYVDTIRFNVPGAFTATTGAGGSGYMFLVGGILVTPNVGPTTPPLPTAVSGLPSAYTSAGNCPIDVYQNNIAGELYIDTPFNYYSSTARRHMLCQRRRRDGRSYRVGKQQRQLWLTLSQWWLHGDQQQHSNRPGSDGGGALLERRLARRQRQYGPRQFRRQRASRHLAWQRRRSGGGDGIYADGGRPDWQCGEHGPAGDWYSSLRGEWVCGGLAAGNRQRHGEPHARLWQWHGEIELRHRQFLLWRGHHSGGATLNINSEWQLGGANQGPVTFNNGTLQYSNSLYNAAVDISGQPVTLAAGGGTIDVNTHAITFANAIGNGGSGQLTVTNSGAGGGLYLNGGSTHTGGTRGEQRRHSRRQRDDRRQCDGEQRRGDFSSSGAGATTTIGGQSHLQFGSPRRFQFEHNLQRSQ